MKIRDIVKIIKEEIDELKRIFFNNHRLIQSEPVIKNYFSILILASTATTAFEFPRSGFFGLEICESEGIKVLKFSNLHN